MTLPYHDPNHNHSPNPIAMRKKDRNAIKVLMKARFLFVVLLYPLGLGLRSKKDNFEDKDQLEDKDKVEDEDNFEEKFED